MARKGNTFISYTSADGANWSEYSRRTIAMPSTLYFGIAMNAHDNGLAATGTIELQTTRLQPWYYPSRTDRDLPQQQRGRRLHRPQHATV